MDVFISYRTTSGSIPAKMFSDFFTTHGISCFYDVNSLYDRTGEFPELLQQAIRSADNFLLILSIQALDSLDETAILIKEIALAIKENKNIIPVTYDGFYFPTSLPNSIETLPKLQAVKVDSRNFDQNTMFRNVLAKMTVSPGRNAALAGFSGGSRLEARRVVDPREDLNRRLSGNITEIDLCVFAGQALLNANREYLEIALANNCKFRLVMLDPKCDAAKEATERKINAGSLRIRKRIIPESYEYMLDYCSRYPNFSCRLTDWYLPCAIFHVTKIPEEESWTKVDYYSFHCTDGERRCAYIRPSDIDNYKFYQNEFEHIWEHARAVMPEEWENL